MKNLPNIGLPIILISLLLIVFISRSSVNIGSGEAGVLFRTLGGGVVTDLGGFVAAAFKRGIHFINIPTTLLSMVDASVGGKTGVDFQGLKNQIGIITNPELVIIDSIFLKTLPENEYRSGYSEMLKHVIIIDVEFFKKLFSSSNSKTLTELTKLVQMERTIHLD